MTIADIDEAQAERVRAEAPEGRIAVRRTDVTDDANVKETVAATLQERGSIDVLVNCAGWTVDRLFRDKPREEWEREIAIDFWGFINFTRAVLDHMVERDTAGSSRSDPTQGGSASGGRPSTPARRRA